MITKETKILLVDDDDLSRRMMGLLLAEKGYNCDTAINGVNAVSAVKSQSYDIVLMDLQMPIMDGFEATQAIREWEGQERHTPIVALTAMLFDNEIEKCLEAGMDAWIAKPFNTEALFRLIDSFVNKLPETKDLQDSDDIKGLMLLDIEDALPRFSRDIQVYEEFLHDFIDDLQTRLKQFHEAFEAGNWQALADNAHNLKGISASMGAKQLSHLSHLLDRKSREGDTRLVQQVLNKVEKHVLLFQAEAVNSLSEFKKKMDDKKI